MNLWADRLDHREIHNSQVIKTSLQPRTQDHEIVIGTEVLIEPRALMTRNLQPPLSAADCRRALDALSQFHGAPMDTTLAHDGYQLLSERPS